MGFDKTDLLRQTGYGEGDVIPITTYTPPKDRLVSTTSTTFTAATSLGDAFLQWDKFQQDGSLQILGQFRFQPGSGETMSGRFRNVDDGETVVEATGTSGSNTTEVVGFQSYTPTTTGSPINIRYEHKVDTGTNSSFSRVPTLTLGVQL